MMRKTLNRREFLKLLGLLPFSYFTSNLPASLPTNIKVNVPNLLLIVFDAFSSHNISLYGYPRVTTPNLERLANRATIYHNHYSAGNFTTPGTASLLTGTYPWTHRAFQINNQVHETFQDRNIFHLFEDYHRISYSHNQLVSLLQDQFSRDIDSYKPREDLTLGGNKWLPKVFGNDEDAATLSWARATGANDDDLSSSLVLSNIFKSVNKRRSRLMEEAFPLGLPISSLDHFLLEDAVDWLASEVAASPQPFLGYFHFLPPHAPYHTRIEFAGAFSTAGIPSKRKPKHQLAKTGRIKRPYGMDHYRRTYDEYILYVDSEFNRLFSTLGKTGILDNTVVILTSDHGEMFERGILGHTTPSLHDPIVRIPLLIFEPHQVARKDIYSKTSAVDLLPTLLYLAGKPIPSWSEGFILPPHTSATPERSVFALEAKTNKPLSHLKSASAMIVRGDFKLTKYFGYRYLPKGDTFIELYDIEGDPEELNEISKIQPQLTAELLAELESRIVSADKPYR